MRALLLPLGTWTLAAELSSCREVVDHPVLTPLVTAPPVVLGLINVRGAAVPVLDTARLLDAPGMLTSEPAYVVVVDSPAGSAGLALTGCPEPCDMDDDAAGVILVGDRTVTVVDVGALVAGVRQGA